MKVQLLIQFESPTADDHASLRRVALELTNDPDSVRVVAREGRPPPPRLGTVDLIPTDLVSVVLGLLHYEQPEYCKSAATTGANPSGAGANINLKSRALPNRPSLITRPFQKCEHSRSHH